MRKLLLVSMLCMVHGTYAQVLKGLGGKIKQKVESKTENKILNDVDKKTDQVLNGNVGDSKEGASENNSGNKNSSAPSLKTYSKFDFVPGEKIIVFEDFMQDAVGDFPARWNTNAAGEIMTIEGKAGRWFAMNKVGYFMPEFIDQLPEDFTLEFDMLVDRPVHSWGINISLAEIQDRNNPETWQSADNRFTLNILPGAPEYNNSSSSYNRRKNGVGEAAVTTKINAFANINRPTHVVFWRQKERLRIYLNEDKTWDVPKAVQPGAKLNSLIFAIQNIDKWSYLISNLRLAVGAPDTRKKILEQSKWVTHGILFDVNSDVIKPESYGTIKEMANVLKEYTDLKVKIIGHTDADGSDVANLELSKKRAASVKTALANEFGIDSSRMETDGKGEAEPIDKNDSPAGKANNRRVEFIKL